MLHTQKKMEQEKLMQQNLDLKLKINIYFLTTFNLLLNELPLLLMLDLH